MLVFTTATVAFYFLGATVLYRQGLHPAKSEMIATLAEMYVPTFGDWTRLAFLIGAWAVLFKTLYVASASNSRLSADFLSLGSFLHFDSAGAAADLHPAVVRVLSIAGTRAVPDVPRPAGDGDLRRVLPGGHAAGHLRGDGLHALPADRPRIAPSKISDFCLWLAFLSITVVALYAMRDWGMNQLWPALRDALGGGSQAG